jgi:hypothetical protein
MSAAGLLQQAGSTVFVELGAGKAYLTAWLHLLHPQTKQLILLDKAASFKTKVSSQVLQWLWLYQRRAVGQWDCHLMPASPL